VSEDGVESVMKNTPVDLFPLLFFGHKLRSPCIIIEAPEFKIS